ncbi:MAG: ankyrin repeat domain-containing protein [Bacteroidota bacterium]|nr:ankyrin repeat domain-containing protein [Bacteroidota bacterium]
MNEQVHELFTFLPQSGIDVNTQDTDWNDRTPLHWACMKGHGDIVQLLLKNEANPNLLVILTGICLDVSMHWQWWVED